MLDPVSCSLLPGARLRDALQRPTSCLQQPAVVQAATQGWEGIDVTRGLGTLTG